MLGEAFLKAGQEEQAIRELRIAVSLDPDSPKMHQSLGTALYELQKYDAAAAEFREAVKLEPTAENHYSLAACLISMGNYDRALGELERASQLQPSKELYRARKEELIKLMRASSAR